MTSSWQVLDLIEYEGRISTARGGIEVAGQRVPLDPVSCILLGDKCSWGYGLVAHAVKYDVAVVVCDWRCVPIAYLAGWSENTRVNARHRAQADLSLPRKKSAWKVLVKEKIRNQAKVARLRRSPIERYLTSLMGQVRSGDPANVEAQAAIVAWGELFGSEFSRMREGDDAANAFLNYGYTILRGCIIREVISHGLSPTLGVFHRNRSNRYALADDLIEPFRPIVDLTVLGMLDAGHGTIGRAERSMLVGVLSQPYASDGATVSTVISRICAAYAQYVEGDNDRLCIPAWSV